jgi:hypothetical protein
MQKSVPHESLTLPFEPFRIWLRVGESFFDYEYLREFEAKIGTARNVVKGTHEEPISEKIPENSPHCHVPKIFKFCRSTRTK